MVHNPVADPTYVDDFLLTYRTFLRQSADVTSQLLTWFDDPAHTDKVIHARFHPVLLTPCFVKKNGT